MKLVALAMAMGLVAACAGSSSRIAPPVWRDIYVLDPVVEVVAKHIRGLATWYDATHNNAWYTMPNKWGDAVEFYAAAGPELRKLVKQRWYMEPLAIFVESVNTGIRVKVWVVDWCGCRGRKDDGLDTRLIDLAPAVWDALGVPLYLGVMKVRITIPD